MYLHAHVHICIYVCIYVYIYVFMFICILPPTDGQSRLLRSIYFLQHIFTYVDIHKYRSMHVYVNTYEKIRIH
jgi:hypothetical protein